MFKISASEFCTVGMGRRMGGSCSVNDTKLRRYVASLEAVPVPSKTSNRGAYRL